MGGNSWEFVTDFVPTQVTSNPSRLSEGYILDERFVVAEIALGDSRITKRSQCVARGGGCHSGERHYFLEAGDWACYFLSKDGTFADKNWNPETYWVIDYNANVFRSDFRNTRCIKLNVTRER